MMKVNKIDFSWLSIGFCALAFLLNILFSEGVYDTSDGLAHFEIARNAIQHPALFLDHWGKPLFTFLAAPFTFFGIRGVLFMNLILFVITSIVLVRFLRHLQIPFAWSAPIFVAISPVYYQVLMSGLTEVLFATLLISALYLFSKMKFGWSALIVSAMLFSRSEAYFVLPVFGLAFLFKRQWKSIFILATFPLLLSVVGFFVLDDFLWMINENPYVGAKAIYGSGDSLWYFVQRHEQITGGVLGYLFLLGALILFLGKSRQLQDEKWMALFMGFFIVLFVVGAHSVFWWKGLFGSFGLLRVLATVVPIIVAIGLFAFQPLLRPKRALPIVLILLFFGQKSLREWQPKLLPKSTIELQADAVKNWLENAEYANAEVIWFMHPVFEYTLKIDPYEKYGSDKLWSLNHVLPSSSLPVGGLIIWDGWHAPNEGHTSLETLRLDKDLREVFHHRLKNPNDTMDEKVVRIFAKMPPANDSILAHVNFSAGVRPILEDRYGVIKKDENGRKFHAVPGNKSSVKIYSFWMADSAIWRSPKYRLNVDAVGDWQLVLVEKFKEREDEVVVLGKVGAARNFKLPASPKGVVLRELFLQNTQDGVEGKLYGWQLEKASNPP